MPDSQLAEAFRRKKERLLCQLRKSDDEYEDLSPKGSVDSGLVNLVNLIAAQEPLVTTSSCSGRLSVFLEGQRQREQQDGTLQRERIPGSENYHQPSTTLSDDASDGTHATRRLLHGTAAGVGGKGGGGRWLFVSHDPVEMPSPVPSVDNHFMTKFGLVHTPDAGLSPSCLTARFVHLKFEPMILHILAASLDHAQLVLTAALQAGFRESGAMSITARSSPTRLPMVAVRTNGLAFDSVIGYLDENDGQKPDQIQSLVNETYLRTLVNIANHRFEENEKRKEQFGRNLLEMMNSIRRPENLLGAETEDPDEPWEDSTLRRQRKRMEGLRQQQEKSATCEGTGRVEHVDSGEDMMLDLTPL
ncbi:MAG: hypothetical protein M1817_003753 [Caeruleum heppii]|nr:MAG: hypothetical protein M1817_003753 [Caeruleum heppii]